jgi:hypothetical protein
MTISYEFGKVTGMFHRRNQINCQDSYYICDGGDYLVSSVADGMGSGSNSEFSASFFSRTMTNFLFNLLSRGVDLSSESDRRYIVNSYSDEYVRQFDIIYSLIQFSDRASFCDNYMMHTQITLIVDKATNNALVLSAGDGYVSIDANKTGQKIYLTSEFYPHPPKDGTYYPADIIIRNLKVPLFNMFYVSSDMWQHNILIATDGLRDILNHMSDILPNETDESGYMQSTLTQMSKDMIVNISDDTTIFYCCKQTKG